MKKVLKWASRIVGAAALIVLLVAVEVSCLESMPTGKHQECTTTHQADGSTLTICRNVYEYRNR